MSDNLEIRRWSRIKVEQPLPDLKLPPQVLPGICKGDYGVLAGMGGAGKSTFALTWAVFRLLGLEFYADKGLPALTKISYFAFEETPLVLKKRFVDILKLLIKRIPCGYPGPDFFSPMISEDEVRRVIDNLDLPEVKGVPIRFFNSDGKLNKSDVDELNVNIPDNTDLLIIDPLIKIGGFNENDNGAAGQFATELEKIALEKNLGILMIHHVSKQSSRDGLNDQFSVRGASAIVDESRATYPMRNSVVDISGNCYIGLTIESPKLNYLPPQPPTSFFKTKGGIPLPNLPVYQHYAPLAIRTEKKEDCSIKLPRRKYTKKETSV